MLVPGIANPDAWILGDVHHEPRSNHRAWTGAHPRFAFRLQRTENVDLAMRLDVHSIPFSHTGPVTLRIRVNGELVDQLRYDASGFYDYSRAIRPSLLQSQSPVEVSIDIDPAWRDEDGQVYGIGLYYIGFQEHPG